MTSEPVILRADWVAPMSRPLLRDGSVAMKDGRIDDVGPANEVLARHPGRNQVDLGKVLLTPGLVNAHTHLELTNLPRAQDPRSFVDWIFQVLAHVPPPGDEGDAATADATRAGIAQCLKFGVTTVGDITRRPAVTRREIGQSPLRAVSFGEVTAMGERRGQLHDKLSAAMASPNEPRPSGSGPVDLLGVSDVATVDASAPSRSRLLECGTGVVISAVSPHAPYSVEPEGYVSCIAAARHAGVPIATHLAETPDEMIFLMDQVGAIRRLWDAIGGLDDHVRRWPPGTSPVRFAAQLGLLDTPLALLAHANYVDEDDLRLLAAGRASVVYCPRTHAYFGHTPHPWKRMLALGVNVALGTDSAASSPDLNLLDDARLLRSLAPDFPAVELWRMVTTRGARALGLDKECGALETGLAADVLAFAVGETNDPLAAALDEGKTPTQVWIGGRRMM